MVKRVLLLLLAAALQLTGSAALAAPDSYSGAPISGRVVDAATGKPLEGAVVVADWTLWHRGLLVSGDRTRRLWVAEAITDAQGRYQVPGWGPIERPFGWDMHPLGVDDPNIAVFAPGYEPEFFINSNGAEGMPPFNPPEARLRRSFWDGRDLRLYRYGTIDRNAGRNLGSDPSVKSTPETRALARLESFASHLERNVHEADGRDEPNDSPRRREFMERQRTAFLLADDALRQFTGKPRIWSWGINDFVTQLRRGRDQK